MTCGCFSKKDTHPSEVYSIWDVLTFITDVLRIQGGLREIDMRALGLLPINRTPVVYSNGLF